jgi:hypothetical protein
MAFLIPYDQGYDVTSHGTDDSPSPNGRIHFPGENGPSEPLWVIDVSMDFGLAGIIAQSRKTRSFFPHNSIPPTISVSCQTPNQLVYGRTVEFIRNHQLALDTAFLAIPGKGITSAGYHHKGKHGSISAHGYVQAVRRRHVKFDHAPEFTFAFVVASFKYPEALRDTMVSPRQMKTWSEIVADTTNPNAAFGEAKRPQSDEKAPDSETPDRPATNGPAIPIF